MTTAAPNASSAPSAPSIETIAPKPTNRALIVGQTGSGKTTLAYAFVRDALVRRDRHVVVIDSKGLIAWQFPASVEHAHVASLADAVKSPAQFICYRPTYAESQNETAQAQLWDWLYRRRNTTVYVDETAALTNGDVFPFYYGAILMRGRELGLELWSATQRPMRIPQNVLSESEDAYAFKLRLPQDRARVESLTGIPADTIAQLKKREFVYAPQDGDVSGTLTLNLGR
jgi:energy-coupling factor transporter ATP-binding protein EcfA2